MKKILIGWLRWALPSWANIRRGRGAGIATQRSIKFVVPFVAGKARPIRSRRLLWESRFAVRWARRSIN